MHAGEYCNRDVVIAERKTGIQEAARLMRHHHVGDLVVVERIDDLVRPVGIVTDRDLVIEVLAEDVEPAALTVEDVMSARLEAANEYDDVIETLRRMRTLGIRRIPVVDQHGGLAGILAVDDLLGMVSGTLHDIVMLISREVRVEEKNRP
ncbi:MAG: CBS domain-containing protein [Pseudomonadota bacterium]|jgi:CBS domain-containing protein